MSMLKVGVIPDKNIFPVAKRNSLKTIASRLMSRLHGISENHQRLWNAYHDASSVYSTPRCLWRRHGALLMYSRRQHASSQRILEKYDG